jgi:hypothetical protein
MIDPNNRPRTTDPWRDAAAALASVQLARASIAARAGTPWWYPPSYGAGVGGLVATLALPASRQPLGMMASIAWLLLVYWVWSRQSGMRVYGFRGGRTRTIAVGLGVAIVSAVLMAVALRERYPDGRAAMVGGVVLAVIAARASVAWDRAWRAELRDSRDDLGGPDDRGAVE